MRGFRFLLAAAVLATPALAAEDDWPAIKGARLHGQQPFAAYAVYLADGRVTGVSLYPRPDGGFAARRLTGEGVQWATSRSCPALNAALERLEDLPAPLIEVPGVGRTPRTAALALDGDSYFLWADGARWGGGGHAATLELRAVNGSPLADWIDGANVSMRHCWSPDLP